MTREPSLGELAEDLKDMRAENKEGIARIQARLDELDRIYIRKDVYVAHQTARDSEVGVERRRITELEGRLTWAFRAAITALVFPVVVGVIVGLILAGGLS